MKIISIEEYNEWRESYITKKLFKWFKQEEHFQRSHAATGGCIRDSFMTSGEEYMKTLIRAQFCEEMQTLEYEDLIPEEERNESHPDDISLNSETGPSRGSN